MRLIFIAVLALAGWSGVVQAQTVGGKYTVSGTNPNGSSYTGTATVTPSGSACRISWQTGSTKSAGICMLAKRAFVAYYKLGNQNGLVVYELHDNGSLSGWWTIADQEGIGTESLTPQN